MKSETTKPKTIKLNLTKNQMKKLKKELLEPNDIKCFRYIYDDKKRFGLIAQPTICSEILTIRLLNEKEFNIINKACVKIGCK